jgi:hypothetical protein
MYQKEEGEQFPPPWRNFAETKAAFASLVLTGGFLVCAYLGNSAKQGSTISYNLSFPHFPSTSGGYLCIIHS